MALLSTPNLLLPSGTMDRVNGRLGSFGGVEVTSDLVSLVFLHCESETRSRMSEGDSLLLSSDVALVFVVVVEEVGILFVVMLILLFDNEMCKIELNSLGLDVIEFFEGNTK
jgi:hypothetical protein